MSAAAVFNLGAEEIRYPEHLRWTCIRCGRSCRDVQRRRRNILLTLEDAGRIVTATKLREHEFSRHRLGHLPYYRRMKKQGGTCIFLRGSSCSIYEHRPLICRFYPFSLQRSERGGLEIRFDTACSGIGKGPIRGEKFFADLVKLAREELSQA